MMLLFIVGGFSTAVVVGLGAFTLQKMKSNESQNGSSVYKKDIKQVEILFEDITKMNPFEKNKNIFEKGQELILISLRIRNSSNHWYSDNKVLQLLLDYDNLYKSLLEKYSYDAHLEQMVFESLVTPYQAFWINLDTKQSSEERIKYMKDMFTIFKEMEPLIEAELELFIKDNEVKENLIVHNGRIQSQEVVNKVFQDSISRLRDKKEYSIAKTINDTHKSINADGQELNTPSTEAEKKKDKLTIDDL